MSETSRQIDNKGRITIPQDIRERLNLEAGSRVHIAVDDGTVVVRPQVSRAEFIESMQGCLTGETKADDAPDITPDEIKSDWISDLPTDS